MTKIDLRSKSDAQVAEAVIVGEVSKLLGYKPKRPSVRQGVGYRYGIPHFIEFKDEELNDVLDTIEGTRFRVGRSGNIEMPEALSGLEIPIGDSVYRLGIGGLHSSEKSAAHYADEDHVLTDRDVISYYPRIIIGLGLRPEHLGWAFQKVYKKIVARRVKAKGFAKEIKAEIKSLKTSLAGRNDNGGPSLTDERIAELQDELKAFETVADSLKITVNGSFGKFGNQWSSLYSPQLLIQVTITGQLSLLMLIHRLERAGIKVVSANTDGVVIKCPRHLIGTMDKIVARWEQDTGFGTEATEYAALYSRDVNNYIAVKTDGEVKTKGAFAPTGFQKNPTNEICVEAVKSYLTNGVPISRTIRECRDITKFVTVRTVKGGAVWGARAVEFERFGKRGNRLKPGVRYELEDAEYLGKAIRWYYSDEVDGAIHYKSNGNKVPRSDGARPLMELPDEFPGDVDFGWYIREARSILEDIGHSRGPV